jgi:FkbH-like protein
VANEAATTHPEMILRWNHFAATKINWDDKPGNVRQIADDLDIGLDAVVFVDDNPVERGQMRALAPEVSTVELPGDPAGYAHAIARRGDFATLRLTGEDVQRTPMYRAQAQRRELARSSASQRQFLLDLATRIRFEPATPINLDRLSQLFAKTNQFNLTGRRYSTSDLARDAAEPAGVRVFGVRARDRFGDNGLIAGIALRRPSPDVWLIENLVLSCRVFSRGIEVAIVGRLLRDAAASGAATVVGMFRRTRRNARFADFYPRLGFAAEAGAHPGEFRHNLHHPPAIPEWIELPTKEVFHVP